MSYRSSDKFLSIKITRLLMQAVGLWTAETVKEKKILNGIFAYTLFAVACALWTEGCDFYLSMGDFYAITYTACSTMPVIVLLTKLCVFMYHRQTIIRLVRFTQKKFWYAEYDQFGTQVLEEADKTGIVLISAFTFFVAGVVVTYALNPVVENIGKNETDRILPFNIWLGVPVTMTPYFEIAYFMETFALIHSGICFCCFDNLLFVLNIHVAVQFKLLGNRLRGLFRRDSRRKSSLYKKKNTRNEFRQCLHQHRMLISYVNIVEQTFTYSMMFQLLVSSILICIAGFQVILARGTIMRKLLFVAHVSGCFLQLFVLTFTANEVIVQSRAVGDAAYESGWETSTYENDGDTKTGLLMMMFRSSKPCCLTAGGFLPVSLETFMAVLSSAASYFTLLRKMDPEMDG